MCRLGLPAALRHLTQLTSLICSSDSALPELSSVLPLTLLRQLNWMEQRQVGVLPVDLQQLLARLPQLERWWIIASEGMGEASLQARALGSFPAAQCACACACV